MKILLIAFLLFFTLNAVSQQSVTIAGEAYSYNGMNPPITVLSPLKTPTGEFVHLASIDVKPDNKFHYKLPLNKPCLLVIHYLEGNRVSMIYAIPGDSIHINFEKLQKPDTVKSGASIYAFKERAHISGSSPARIAFFQTLNDQTGYIYGPPFTMNLDTVDFLLNFKKKLAMVYQNRLKILNDEANKYHFVSGFKTFAKDEIYGEYVEDLISVVFYRLFLNKYPSAHFNEVDNYQSTWDVFKNSRSNYAAIYALVMYYHNRENNQTKEQLLATEFENCTEIKDDSIRNYMMTRILAHSIESHPSNFDDLLERYQSMCTNPIYVSDLLGIYKSKFIGKPLPMDVLNSLVKTDDGQIVSLKNIISGGKPVLIDFWASWCAPCKLEIPMLKQLAEKYGDKMDFRFISVDKVEKESDWLTALKAAKFTGKQYLLQDKTLIDFANLKSIPRYLIIDKDGNLNTYRGPDLISDEQGFENRIKAVIGN